MSAWTNIQFPPGDVEISAIDELEKALGAHPENVRQVRELITRFEVCHFKYRQHLEKIRKSIKDLHPVVDPANIGRNHIQHGDKAWESDKTGRSFMGQQYLWALNNWLLDNQMNKPPEYNDQLAKQVESWLGERNSEKDKMVRLLLARLMWDWKTLEELSRKTMEEISREGDDMGLEYQIYRMDICHFAFPLHLIDVIRGIGALKPVDRFEGCGTHNQVIRNVVQAEIAQINRWLTTRKSKDIPEKDHLEEATRVWLYACLAKTLKAQAGLRVKIVIHGKD